MKYKDEVHEGEHSGIVDPGMCQKVQNLLRNNAITGGAPVCNQFGAILKGMLRCAACDCAMSPSHTTKGNRRYRYYLCGSAQKKGWKTCPSKSIPAEQIEKFVVEQIRRKAASKLERLEGGVAKVVVKSELTISAGGAAGDFTAPGAKIELKSDRAGGSHTFDTKTGRVKEFNYETVIGGTITPSGDNKVVVGVIIRQKQTVVVSDKNPIRD